MFTRNIKFLSGSLYTSTEQHWCRGLIRLRLVWGRELSVGGAYHRQCSRFLLFLFGAMMAKLSAQPYQALSALQPMVLAALMTTTLIFVSLAIAKLWYSSSMILSSVDSISTIKIFAEHHFFFLFYPEAEFIQVKWDKCLFCTLYLLVFKIII